LAKKIVVCLPLSQATPAAPDPWAVRFAYHGL